MSTRLSSLALRTRWALLRLQAAAQTAPAAAAAPPVNAMGLAFSGRLGLAAGFDRRGALWPDGHRLGLAAVECAAPGIAALAGGDRPRAVRGISLSKPPGLSWEVADAWFVGALRTSARHADYLTLNPGRERPEPAHFVTLVAAVCAARGGRQLPVVAKLPAAWLAGAGRLELARAVVAAGAAGLLLSAEGAADAEAVLGEFAAEFGKQVCLISVGGIASVATALARRRAGADLLQVHRSLITRGPGLVAAINAALARGARPGDLHR